jgi:hypothetical protein
MHLLLSGTEAEETNPTWRKTIRPFNKHLPENVVLYLFKFIWAFLRVHIIHVITYSYYYLKDVTVAFTAVPAFIPQIPTEFR